MATDVLVLKQLGASQLEKAVEEARTVVLMRCKLVLDQKGRRTPAEGFVQNWWRASATPQVSVMLVVDDGLACAWVEVSDDDPARRACIVGALTDHLSVVPIEQLAMNAKAWPPAKGALAALAISGAIQQRDTLAAAVEKALDHGPPSLKIEAAFAATTGKLVQVRAALERAADAEPPGSAREAIVHALSDLQRS